MPELPEVETIRRVLEPQLCGRTVTSVTVNRPEIIAHPTAEEFCARVTSAQITGLGRRGKYLAIHFKGGAAIRLHLRMTGQLLVTPPDFPSANHTHLVCGLDDGQQLRFIDTRRFGRFWFFAPGEEDCISGVSQLGPEPSDPALTAGYLSSHCGHRRRAIKDCLLDQKLVAGIGNIYSDEILFLSHILPDRPACSLTPAEWERLAAAIPAAIRYFIDTNAISPEDYLAGMGRDYRNTPFLRVYGHGKEPCPVCGRPLQRSVIAGRSSVFCTGCQH